jgi:SAM-dependent methyltransferase
MPSYLLGQPDPNAQRPFADPAQIPGLYADHHRVDRRSNALLNAKTHGLHVGETAADLLTSVILPARRDSVSAPVVADIGCGNGRPTRALLTRFPHARFLAVDASAAMLAQARAHLAPHQTRANDPMYLQADFHHLPLADQAVDAATAFFCLYHSGRPGHVLYEISRVLKPTGMALMISKSGDSYQELDQLMVDTGLDTDATRRPSLYAAASGEDLPTLAAASLNVVLVLRDPHVFCFRDARHLADYLVTIPKYQLGDLRGDPAALAAELRRRRGDGPTTATSTITYVLASRRSS